MSETIVQKSTRFLKEVWIELHKVAWPTMDELKSSTMVVVVTVFLVAIFIGVIDFGLSRIVRLIFSL